MLTAVHSSDHTYVVNELRQVLIRCRSGMKPVCGINVFLARKGQLFSKLFAINMGNQTVYQTFDYPLPQPSDDTWSSYLRHCSLRQFENLMYSFETKYKGKVVEWEGTVATVSDRWVQFVMNPSESSRTRYDVTLCLNDETRQTYPAFVVGATSTFKGRLTSLGTFGSHKLTAVPLASSEPVIPFTWLDFCRFFGVSAQKSADLFFVRAGGGAYHLADFTCTDLDPSAHPEPVKLRVYRFNQAVFKKLDAAVASKETVTVCASVLKRKSDCHELRLHCFIPKSFKSTAALGKEPEEQTSQYATWDYAPDDFHVSAVADRNSKDDEPQPAQNPEFKARMDLGALPSAPPGGKMEIIS
ncbi:hypothetical protein BLNAU_11416 [Blattamonas nauphoetae]|uniref:Uncharacterized protein n=1 Tax=Blattamonas nauphoetae TaxID=2049346 RepID=A0ABQ9XSN2_9EUKA|nr:hypothetical protein BLNAU_11416 [Blattamonas nauphoetae]